MYRILRTDPVTVVQIFEREVREGLERGTERRGREGHAKDAEQRRGRGLGTERDESVGGGRCTLILPQLRVGRAPGRTSRPSSSQSFMSSALATL